MSESHYFIAIPLKQDIKKKLAAWQDHLKKELHYRQWTYPDDLHITLKFLGPVKQHQLNQLQTELSVIHEQNRFEMNIGSIGSFGNPKKPRVLWAGVKKTAPLVFLQRLVEECAQDTGFTSENRPYRPHITLAKKWNGQAETDRLADIKQQYQTDQAMMDVDEVVIYQIHPRKNPKYEIIETYKLSK